MFNLFNIFKKKENTEEEIKGQEEAQESDIRASITYFIREDGSPYVDISIVKTNEENINTSSKISETQNDKKSAQADEQPVNKQSSKASLFA